MMDESVELADPLACWECAKKRMFFCLFHYHSYVFRFRKGGISWVR